ncbi:hypothetical protein [Sorangium sp. So ce1099]|uniref:hypothetical protein n=1 Tax=Sorangium sp. So ce1099 TaxID=3133331 RepID=UPI003F5DB215
MSGMDAVDIGAMSSMEDLRAEVAQLREQVAELSRARDQAIRERDDLLSAMRQMPSAIALVRGPEHVFEFVNDAWRAVVPWVEPIGRRSVDAIPELMKEQGILALFDRVFATGEPLVGESIPTTIHLPGGGTEQRFFTVQYIALRSSSSCRSWAPSTAPAPRRSWRRCSTAS